MDTPLVAVVWDDAHSYSDEIETADLKHWPEPIVTYGLLTKDSEAGVSLSCEQTGLKHYRGHTFIPRPLIQQIVVIRKKPIRAKSWTAQPSSR